jgi:8-oxo-dGTP pyrophosphatase MutT (NUDIX family)
VPHPASRPDRAEDLVLPEWLVPVADKARTLRAEDLSGFLPPTDPIPREGAVLVLFGEGPAGPDLLLTERAHTMRSQPGQVSFPGGSLDPGESAVEGALREAQEETGLDPAGIDVFAVLPRIWLPPRNFAVTPVLGFWRHDSTVAVTNPLEVHAVFRVPIADLLEPANRFSVRHPLGWTGPAWFIGPSKDVLLWGFTAGIIDSLFTHVGWTREWDREVMQELPERHLQWRRAAGLPAVDPDRDHRPGR